MIQTFTLLPFVQDEAIAQISLKGQVQREISDLKSGLKNELKDGLKDTLTLHYELSDPQGVVSISPSALPTRRDGLWQATCFEFFLGAQDSRRYWEFNLSPAGHWNVYQFEDYRQGMQSEPAWDKLPFRVRLAGTTLDPRANNVTVDLSLDLTRILPASVPLDLAIATVILLKDGTASYWSLTHCAPQPDFHQRQSFAIRL